MLLPMEQAGQGASGKLSGEIREQDTGDGLIAIVLDVEAATNRRASIAVPQQGAGEAMSSDQGLAEIG